MGHRHNRSMPMSTESSLQARKAIALRSIEIMATGTAEEFAEVTHREFFNHEQRDEPPATRGPGPERAYGVAQWLRAAYSGLRWDVHDVVAEDDLVAVRCTMSGRHTGDFVAYDLAGHVAETFPPTRRRFTSTSRTGCGSATGRPSSTGRTRRLGMATSSAGRRRPRATSCAPGWPSAGPAGPPTRRARGGAAVRGAGTASRARERGGAAGDHRGVGRSGTGSRRRLDRPPRGRRARPGRGARSP